MSGTANHKRIARNTLFLYFRMLLVMGVSLYTVRVVLRTLGIEDYGTYNAVGGLVALGAFLPGTLASATQRFFSYALADNDAETLRKTFCVNCLLYVAIAALAVLLLESVGLWFVNEHLKIPADRFDAAQQLYHLSVLTFVATILTSPFNAIIIAHEDMHIYAYISISDALAKLGSVFLLTYIPWDKLELYGALLLLTAVANAAVYIGICIRKYDECQFRKFYWDGALLGKIVSFTGWTLFGQLSTVFRNHAVTVLLNQSFNPAVVAARAVAVNVATQVNVFSANFNTSLYPPIIKAYASGNKDEMFSLVFNGSKITFFLMWMLALPLFIEMETVLSLWLGTPPPDAVLFTRLALAEALILSISLPLMTAARAPGKVGTYELTLGLMQIAIFFISWALVSRGASAHSVFLVAIAVNALMFLVRLLIVNSLTGISVLGYLKAVALPAGLVAVLSGAVSAYTRRALPGGVLFSALGIATTMTITALCVYFFGLDRHWRAKIRSMVQKRLRGARA